MFDNTNWKNEGFPRHVAVYMADVYMTLIKFLMFYSLGVGFCFTIGSQYLNLISATSVFMSLISTTMTIISEEKKFWSNLTAVFTGVMTGPLFILTLIIDPSIIVYSLTGTIVLFFCLTCCAYHIRIKKMFYVGSLLSSMLSTFIIFNVLNLLFFKSFQVYWLHIYFTLIFFSFYVLYDTRIMIERASEYLDYEENKKNYELEVIVDSMNIFFDIINIFIKLVIVLLDDKKKRKR